MTSTERWVVLPAFVLAGALVVLLGVRAIRTRRMPLRKQWLHGKKEVTGGVAVGLGVAMSAIGLAMIAGAVAMMVLGRALL